VHDRQSEGDDDHEHDQEIRAVLIVIVVVLVVDFVHDQQTARRRPRARSGNSAS
jgi:hypothetical protein